MIRDTLTRAKRAILIMLGFVFLGLGIVGAALPVMPATPFVLLAAACFSVGNSAIAGWLRRNRIFGPYIENYHTKRGISKRRKAAGVIFVWTGLVISMILTQTLWISVLLGIVGACVTAHLLLMKTKDGN